MLRPTGNQLWPQLRDQLWDRHMLPDRFWRLLWNQIEDQLLDQVWSPLRDQFNDQLWNQYLEDTRGR